MKHDNSIKTVMVVDRNRNVRRYLKRELESEGYRILLAENAQDLLQPTLRETNFDLVVIDPNLPDDGIMPLLQKLQQLHPGTPVVIHTFTTDVLDGYGATGIAEFVEKGGGSIERLKQVIKCRLAK